MANKKNPVATTSAALGMKSLPLMTMVQIIEHMLTLMQEVMLGKISVEDVQYQSTFGSKEGLVPQLQRLCNILKELQALSLQVDSPQNTTEVAVRMDADEQALIAYYVEALKAQQAKAEQILAE